MRRDEAVRPHWDDIGLVTLLAGVFIGPAAWLLNLQMNYSLVKWACASGRGEVLVACSGVALAVVLAGFVLSWRCFTRLRAEADPQGGRVIDRSYFLAVAGMSLNAVFALLIVTSGAQHLIVGPCE